MAKFASRKLALHVRMPGRPTAARPHFQQSRIEQLNTAAAIWAGIGGPLDLDAFVGELTRFVRDHYAYDQARIFLWSAPNQRLCRTPADVTSSSSAEMALADAEPLRDVYERGAPVLLRSRAMLPIHFGGRVIGVLDLHSQSATRTHLQRTSACNHWLTRSASGCITASCMPRRSERASEPKTPIASRPACWPMSATSFARRST